MFNKNTMILSSLKNMIQKQDIKSFRNLLYDKDTLESKEDFIESLDLAIKTLEQQSSDTVSRGAFEQVMWERDVAIEQLKELGYELGQKIEHCDDAISRNAVIQTLNKMDRYTATELTLCDTNKKFPANEVFIVDDVYEQIAEQLPSVTHKPIECDDAINRPRVVKFEGTNMACMGGDEIMKEFENNPQQNNDKATCDDAISRQAVLDRIRESIETYHNQYTTDMLNMWGLFTQFIKEMPSVRPQEPIDAVSREAVCNIVNDIRDCISVEGYWAFLERLKSYLPSHRNLLSVI